MKRKLSCAARWIWDNLLLPLIPIGVRMALSVFSSKEIDFWDPNDLLYYNFFICILLMNSVRKRKGIIAAVVYYLSLIMCLLDILLIVVVLLEGANEHVLPFSLRAAAICAGFGVIFAVSDAFVGNGGGDRA